jgi:exodeoxyribonuclease VII small subunit
MSDETANTSGGDPVSEGYAAALDELEAILAELEDDDIDVDALAGRVERASDLLKFCRERIDQAEMTVERIVTDLADDTPDTGEANAEEPPDAG